MQSNKSEFNTVYEWRKACTREYISAKKQGFLKEVCEYYGWELPIGRVIYTTNHWTKEKCFEEANKYKARVEWKTNNVSSYNKAKNEGWLSEICKLHNWGKPKSYSRTPKGHWTLERCMIEALKYDTVTKWRKGNLPSYEAARKDGWINECTAHMPILKIGAKYWTLERCIEDALKYGGRWEWQKAKGGYNVAKAKGWLDICCGHMPQVKRWTYDEVKKVALTYEYASDWENGDRATYSAARTNDWYKELTAHMGMKIKPRGYWNNKELCIKIIGTCNSKEEIKKNHPSVSSSIRRNGWYHELTAHFKPILFTWTKEDLLEEANKYETTSEFSKGSNGAYQVAWKNGWLDYVTQNLIESRKPNGYWNDVDKIKIEALKYETRTAFMKGSTSAHQAARRLKVLDDVCSHMGKKRTRW